VSDGSPHAPPGAAHPGAAPPGATRPPRREIRDPLDFGGDGLWERVAALDPAAFDALPYGAAEIEATGVVRRANATLAAIMERPGQRLAGRDWFREVAPNTRGPAFEGRMKRGLADGALDAMVEYTLDYKMSPTRVRVQMQAAPGAGAAWVFVKRL